jgi:hypothetical protein
MSQLKIEQAFLLSWLNDNAEFSLPTAYENKDYKPTLQTAYAQIINLPNPLDPLSFKDSDETSGIFRIILRYPINESAIIAKTKAQEILDAYKIGTIVSYLGQSGIIRKTMRQNGAPEDGWYKTVLSLEYFAIITRL